ncbi:ankyrin repeat domain-containing protein [Stieleria varia]|uniref:Ankyrin repeats (3 copies) n=1 Tax=Stieleria varia TaxID=2528005 RepID=A0A5C6B4C5_9BACT|nr:ankyrin repeat domain-containing protein [Stieleria varia]TWU06412.1 Ankyrin repeats (3 copies) [Stieleria varia]
MDAVSKHPECLVQETPFGSWLHFAAKQGALEIVAYLIDLGLPTNQHGGLSDSLPIEQAAAEGHADVVALLIQKGSQLETDVSTRNPLFSAIYAGSIEVVELLLNAGIDHRVRYNGENMKGMDAHAFALERGETEIAALLKNRA